MIVTAYIDINTPTGRRIVKDLETHKSVVRIVYDETTPNESDNEETVAWEEAENYLWKKLEANYGIDLRSI